MTVTWHRSGLLFCPDLSVFREVLCRDCVRPSLRPQPRATPLGKTFQNYHFFFSSLILSLRFSSSLSRISSPLLLFCERTDDELNFLRWWRIEPPPSNIFLTSEQGFRERTGGKDEEEDWTLARAVARLVIIFRVASFEDIPSCVFPRRFKKDGIKFPSGGINSISGERLYYFRRFSILVRHVQSYAIEGENWTCELNRSFKMYFDEFRARITSRDSSLLKILRVASSSSKTRIPV